MAMWASAYPKIPAANWCFVRIACRVLVLLALIGDYNIAAADVIPTQVGPQDDVTTRTEFVGIIEHGPSMSKVSLEIPLLGVTLFTWTETDAPRKEAVFNTITTVTKSYEVFNNVFQSDETGFNPEASTVQIIEVQGVSLNDAGSVVTGFDPTTPQIVPLEPVIFIGNSGTLFTSESITATLGDLPNLLPGFDLSPFVGDPNSIVYISEATLPLTEGLVPEPNSLLLAGFGVLIVLFLQIGKPLPRFPINYGGIDRVSDCGERGTLGVAASN
jgi:hypothetical protein